MSILVVDNDSESRKQVGGILAAGGFTVLSAEWGEFEFASLGIRPPELILLRIRAQGIDCSEFFRRRRESDDARNIPVIVLSGAEDSLDRAKALRMGADDFVATPFQPEELFARVQIHLELRRLRAQAEQRVAERTAQLPGSHELFRTIADAAPFMIWISGHDNGRSFFNKRWLEFTGRAMNDELGDGWSKHVHSDDLERCLATTAFSSEAPHSLETEYRLRRADGEYRWILDRRVSRPTPAEGVWGYIGYCIDVTDLKLNHDKMLAAQKLESLGVMAAGVAHDLGNVLATILAETDLALSEMAAGTPTRESVEQIQAVATRAWEMVKALMASAGATRDSEAFGPVDLSTEVEHILRLLKVSLSKQAVVCSSLSKNIPMVRGIVGQIHQVVINLVTNASDALSGKKGSIFVTTDRVHVTARAQCGLPEGDYVRLKVTDTGCGLNAETRARIFDRFFTTKSTGRGLGLAAVHEIVRSHGGAINVESAPGAGATFEILFRSMRAASGFARAAAL